MSLWNRLFADLRVPSSLSSVLTGNDPRQLAFLRAMQKEMLQDRSLDEPLEHLDVVVVDLETTGFYPQSGDEIISIGAVAMHGSTILEEETFSTLVNPCRMVPESIEALTGISSTDVKTAPALVDALADFFQFVAGRPLVAHHSRHEKDFFQAALWKTSRTKFTHRLLDTSLLFRLEHKIPPTSSLDTLCELYGINVKKRHDAYFDALATAQLWSILLERVRAKGLHTLRSVYEHLSRYP
ncbi:MAG: exonuclease domain-containing protein [Clostridia bacterium]